MLRKSCLSYELKIISGADSAKPRHSPRPARDDWDPTKPLTRAGLDPTPIAEFPYGGQPPHPNAQHDVTVPTAKTDGHHIILAVWDLADRPAAVYACSDVVIAGI